MILDKFRLGYCKLPSESAEAPIASPSTRACSDERDHVASIACNRMWTVRSGAPCLESVLDSPTRQSLREPPIAALPPGLVPDLIGLEPEAPVPICSHGQHLLDVDVPLSPTISVESPATPEQEDVSSLDLINRLYAAKVTADSTLRGASVERVRSYTRLCDAEDLVDDIKEDIDAVKVNPNLPLQDLTALRRCLKSGRERRDKLALRFENASLDHREEQLQQDMANALYDAAVSQNPEAAELAKQQRTDERSMKKAQIKKRVQWADEKTGDANQLTHVRMIPSHRK